MRINKAKNLRPKLGASAQGSQVSWTDENMHG